MPYAIDPDWTKHLKGDGVAPSVVKYYTLLPWLVRNVEIIHIVTSLDCRGRSIQAPSRWWRFGFGRIFPGVVSYFDGCGVMIMNFTGTPNIFYDLRTVKQMANGCCPPQVLYEFMGTERIPT